MTDAGMLRRIPPTGNTALAMNLFTDSEVAAGWPEISNQRIGISNISLKRYRCFSDISVSFDPRLTLIAAPNGEGKTAILDAVAISLRLFIDTLQKKRSSRGFAKEDIQLAVSREGTMENFLPGEPTTVHANGVFWGDKITWTRELRSASPGAKTTTKDARELSQIADGLLGYLHFTGSTSDTPGSKAEILPMISYYGTGRLYSQIKSTQKKKPGKSRLDGYEDCLNPNSSYKAFLAWFGPMSREAQAEQQTGLHSGHRAEERIKAVAKAISGVLESTGWTDVRWDFVNQEPVAFHSDGRALPVRLLSDGVRNMLAMVADMAFRCSQLNPQLGIDAATRTPGIALIDEIDMHLHPEWQQSVLSRLMTVFPEIQFLVSTHSPEVISTFGKEHIRVVKHGRVSSPSAQTSGVPSDRVLASVMGVNPVWGELEAAKWLTRYHSLISQGFYNLEEGADLRTKIIEHYGNNSQQLLECDQAIRLAQIRNKISTRLAKVPEQ